MLYYVEIYADGESEELLDTIPARSLVDARQIAKGHKDADGRTAEIYRKTENGYDEHVESVL